MWLDCDGERVTLIGPVRVIRGTRLVGDTRAVDAWQVILDRHLTAFAREHSLTALVARELLRSAESP